jgi:hypothetical protein
LLSLLLTGLKDRKMTLPGKSRFSPRYGIRFGNQRFAADQAPFLQRKPDVRRERVSNAV